MAITWTRKKFQTGSDAATRKTWLMTNLSGWIYDVDQTNTSNDVLIFQPYTGEDPSCQFRITLANATTDSNVNVSNVSLCPTVGAPSTNTKTVTNIIAADAGGIYFDMATIGGMSVLRITKSQVSSDQMVVLVKETGVADADGGSTTLYTLSAPHKSGSTYYHFTGLLGFLSTTHPGMTFKASSSSSTTENIQMDGLNIGVCTNAILNRFAACGALSNMYTIDGMPAFAPIQNVEFAISVNGHQSTFYSIGHGLCIRE